MNKADVFFSSHNAALSTAFEQALAEAEKNIAKGLAYNEGSVQKFTSEAEAAWSLREQAELGGISPRRYMDAIGSLEELMEMFKIAPILCDEALPSIYTEKIRSFGEPAVEALLETAQNTGWINAKEDMFLVPLMALRLLGEWGILRAVPVMIEMLEMESDNYEMAAEQIQASLIAVGVPAVPLIIEAIERKGPQGTAVEYLLMSLAEIGRNNKSDAIYRCLKNTFQAMNPKIIGILCLKSYGDGRAVPALRGYLEKNRGALDKEIFYETVSAIKALGGSIEGL